MTGRGMQLMNLCAGKKSIFDLGIHVCWTVLFHNMIIWKNDFPHNGWPLITLGLFLKKIGQTCFTCTLQLELDWVFLWIWGVGFLKEPCTIRSRWATKIDIQLLSMASQLVLIECVRPIIYQHIFWSTKTIGTGKIKCLPLLLMILD